MAEAAHRNDWGDYDCDRSTKLPNVSPAKRIFGREKAAAKDPDHDVRGGMAGASEQAELQLEEDEWGDGVGREVEEIDELVMEELLPHGVGENRDSKDEVGPSPIDTRHAKRRKKTLFPSIEEACRTQGRQKVKLPSNQHLGTRSSHTQTKNGGLCRLIKGWAQLSPEPPLEDSDDKYARSAPPQKRPSPSMAHVSPPPLSDLGQGDVYRPLGNSHQSRLT